MRGVGGLKPPSQEEEDAKVKSAKHHVIFVLEAACLEVGKIGFKHYLLNSDDHKTHLASKQKNIEDFRPDICHQSLLAILDSPLCKAGKVKTIFVHTTANVLIKIDAQTKLPRTFRRFSGLLVQLLHKFSIRSTNGPGKLLQCVRGPVTDHFPAEAQVIGLSRAADHELKCHELAEELEDDRPIVFVVGALAHGHVKVDYLDKEVCVSEFPLSAACCLSKLSSALEQKWEIA
ncbi:hypothetical protein BSKO_02093 [Bryopsis sp. KO-2023]|nr:hypothetical protein BSKO_02093 [Bryopsis sp. KO-2023]